MGGGALGATFFIGGTAPWPPCRTAPETQNRLQQFLRKSEPNPIQPTQNLKKPTQPNPWMDHHRPTVNSELYIQNCSCGSCCQ